MNAISSILIIDDEDLILNFMSEFFISQGIKVQTAKTGKDAIKIIRHQSFELIIADLKLPDISGLSILKKLEKKSDTLFVLITAFGHIETAVDAMKAGAFNYILKPISIDTLNTLLISAESFFQLRQTNPSLKTPIQTPILSSKEVFKSKQMLDIVNNISTIACCNSNVMITGESGTGKEVIASLIHRTSNRALQPYIKVNCAAIPDNLLESEFFGHVKGAFTGALNSRAGRFELANRGSILLDEITEISMPLQAKLLRVVQEKCIERLGCSNPIPIDVRIISTSNRNLLSSITQNIFRKDLFYRLNVIPIYLPPLRERIEDITPLAESFINTFCTNTNKAIKTISSEAMNFMLSYKWPGNVRELSNFIERLIVIYEEPVISIDMVTSNLYNNSGPTDPSPLFFLQGKTWSEFESNIIEYALETNAYSIPKAAQTLSLPVNKLLIKMNEYELCSEIQQKKTSKIPPYNT